MYCMMSATVMIFSSATATIPLAKRRLRFSATALDAGELGAAGAAGCANALAPDAAATKTETKLRRNVMGSASYSETR
jgi:hypothetical protein